MALLVVGDEVRASKGLYMSGEYSMVSHIGKARPIREPEVDTV